MEKEIALHPLKLARDYMTQGFYQQAVAEYKRVIQFNATDIAIYHDIALVYLKNGYKRLALDYFYQCGVVCISCRLFVKAKEILAKMNEIDSSSHYTASLQAEFNAAQQGF
jgi:tetratricopeptide (TPR) repeat protein